MWTSGHANSLAFVRDGVAEVKCNATGAPARISRYPFRNNTAPERRHRIDVSVGGEKGSSVAFDFGNTVYPLCKLTSNTNMRLASGELTGDGAELNTNYTDASVAMSAGEKTPLRVKIFYDESTRTGVVGVASGTNFTCSNFSVPTSMTTAFKGVSLYAPKGTANATAYYDDFTWDITPSEVTVEEAAKIDYSNDAQANLDETVTFTYSETLRQPETAAVTVTSGDNTVTTPYTVSYDDNKLLVHFSVLSPNTSYTVTAPTMTTLSGLTTGGLSQSKTFTTVNSTYSATKPSLSDGAVSSTLSVPYAAAKSATLLVAVYNSDGSLNKVTSVAKTIARDGDGTLSINLPTVPTNGSWKAFVWDGLTNLKPLSEAGESNS